MDFSIYGSYSPYVYIVLLSVSLFFLQRLNHVRQRSGLRGASATANALIDFYCALTAFAATLLSWATRALAAFVGYKVGIPAGALLFIVYTVGGTVLTMIVPPGFLFDVIGHVVSLFATPYLVLLTLHSVALI